MIKVNQHRSTKKQRKGVVSKKRVSRHKRSKLYKKAYAGQGR